MNRSAVDNSPRRIWLVVPVVLLLIAVAGLATAAKNGQYYPQTTSAHRVSMATKMNLTRASCDTESEPPRIVTEIPVLDRPERVAFVMPPVPANIPIGVRVSTQHRSPPVSLL